MVLSCKGPELLDAHQQQVVVWVLCLCLLQQPLHTQVNSIAAVHDNTGVFGFYLHTFESSALMTLNIISVRLYNNLSELH